MNYKTKLKDITTFVFDVDGVLTDSSVILSSSGEMVRTMNTRDGLAMTTAVKQGYNVCIITGGNSPMVKKRLNYLGVNDVYMEAGTKTECLDDYCKRKGIERSEILYMGDDVPDYHVMQEVGVSTCPKDAATEILSIADYVSDKVGGKGAVRDVIEQTMRLKGDWFKL